MIPKLIHHLWIDPTNEKAGIATVPPDVQSNLASWSTFEPEYTQKIWILDEILDVCKAARFPNTAIAIRSCRFPSMQADIARLLLLHQFGGFWVDLKLNIRRRFLGHLAPYDLVLTEHFAKDDLPEPNGRLSNSFIGAAPGNTVIRMALMSVTDNVIRRMGGSIYHVTGATNLEIAIRETDVDSRGCYFMLQHQTAWDYLFEIHSGSYNSASMHWSEREQRESPYYD